GRLRRVELEVGVHGVAHREKLAFNLDGLCVQRRCRVRVSLDGRLRAGVHVETITPLAGVGGVFGGRATAHRRGTDGHRKKGAGQVLQELLSYHSDSPWCLPWDWPKRATARCERQMFIGPIALGLDGRTMFAW